MNKGEFVQELKNRLPKDIETTAAATRIVSTVFQMITDALVNGDSVSIADFGNFSAVQREERKGRNVVTGEELVIPAHTAVRFKPGKGLRDAVK